MSDPQRLLDGALPPEVASLLRSAETDDPHAIDEKKDRLLAIAATSSPWATSQAQTASSGLRTARWIGLAAVMIVGGSIAVSALSSSDGPRTSSVRPTVATSTEQGSKPEAAPETEAAPATPIGVPSLHIDELPSAAPPASVHPTAPAALPTAPRAETVTVEDELKTIDAARAALTARRPDETLARVQRYRVAFREPHFVAEADALEVQALAAVGRTEEARTKAEQFFRTHPGSPYTQRVRTAAGASSHEE